jgi:hypothetical protein
MLSHQRRSSSFDVLRRQRGSVRTDDDHPGERLVCSTELLISSPCATTSGYYLVGLRQHHPELFEGVAWRAKIRAANASELTSEPGLTAFIGRARSI